jgi:methionine-gamma-lyase
VNYTGLPEHPQHELANRQMKAHGGMLSFVVRSGIPAVRSVMDSLQLIIHAVTFGTSRTIVMHPRTITHEHMTQEERDRAGIDDGLIRLSVGLEDVEDLIADLDQALAKV